MYKAKGRTLFILLVSLTMLSCSTRKKVPVALTNGQQIQQSKIDLPRIIQEHKSYIDSLGNLKIVDKVLEQKLKSALNIEPNAEVKISYCDTIVELDLSARRQTSDKHKINNIDALSFFTNLKSLNLENNLISNIEPLSNLTHLEKLNLSLNGIRDISAFACLTQLYDLNLYGCEVFDISALSNLMKLTKLNLWNNNIADISSLTNLKNLKYINIGHNQISDLSPLMDHQKIETLWLSVNPLRNPELIPECSQNIKTLAIATCSISNIHFLEYCQNIETLIVFNNLIKDISPIKNMNKLNVFLASNNQIENIDVIAYLVGQGAFNGISGYGGENAQHININLIENNIDFTLETNKKLISFIQKNVNGLEF